MGYPVNKCIYLSIYFSVSGGLVTGIQETERGCPQSSSLAKRRATLIKKMEEVCIGIRHTGNGNI